MDPPLAPALNIEKIPRIHESIPPTVLPLLIRSTTGLNPPRIPI